MERRGFFKGVFGTALAILVPRIAKAKEPPVAPVAHESGTVSLETLANGPFVSMAEVFYRGTRQRMYVLVRVKIGERTVNFCHHGNLADDFADARKFMETLGYKQWVVTAALRKALQ